MGDHRIQRAKLEQDSRAVAFVHDGMYVYANPAFLKLLGYENFAQLEGTPALDMVVDRHKERLREHLGKASRSEGSDEDSRVRVTLVARDGSQEVVIITSRRTRFDEEPVVEISLLTKRDVTLKRIFLDLPWKLYFSVLFLVIFTVLPSGLLLGLNINNAPKVYLPADAPSVVIDDRIREVFPNDQTILLLFEGVALYSDGFLEALNRLAEDLLTDSRIDDVISITTQDHIGGTDDGFLVEPLIDVTTLDSSRPPQRLRRLLEDRFASGALVSADGSAVGMLITPLSINNSLQRMALEDSILARVEHARLNGYLVAMAGQIVTDVAQLRSMLRDNMVFIPGTVIVGLTLIWLLFHRWLAVAVSGIVIGVVVNCTVAFYVVFGQPFNLISSIIPPLLSALTVAALIHLFNALHYASKRGLSGAARVSWAVGEVGRPALYTALTTVAGLASLGLSPIPPISVFGLTAAAGVALIYVIVIHVVPHIFSRFDFGDWPTRRTGLGGMDALVKGLFHTGLRHPLAVVLSVLVALAVGLPQIRHIVVETNLLEFFFRDHQVRLDNEYVEQKLVGTTSLDVVFSSPEVGGLKTPQRLKMIREFQVWAEQQPEVDNSVSMADFIEEMNWGFHGEDESSRQVPDNPTLISQYLLVYDGEDLFDFVDQSFRLAHVNLNVNVHGANDISQLMDRIRHYLQQHVGDEMSWDIAGFGRLFADQEDLLIEGQVYSLGGAVALIFVLMFLQWRSLSSALLCMIPNLSPIVVIFIVMGVSGIHLDMATAMIASVAVGIAVDDTIHVYHGFLQRVRQGISPLVALVRTYRQAGRAVMTTTIILCAQFMVLTTSLFVPTTHFGLLTSIGLLTALLFDLLLLPALLILIYGNRRGRFARKRKPIAI